MKILNNIFALSLCLGLGIHTTSSAAIIYVKKNATGTGDGSSWTNAYTELQPAIDAATSGDQVWVAAATYHPTSWPNGGSTDRERHFSMKNNVSIYGGFAGTEALLSQRDIANNETILSGDFNNDDLDSNGDGFNDTNRSENAYHIFYHPIGINLDPTSLFDGFTITSGNADHLGAPHRYGGAFHNNQSSPTIINSTITNNSAEIGGTFYNSNNSLPRISNSTFSYNSATNRGGAFYNRLSSPNITNCSFSNNSAYNGGGVFYNSSSSPNITSCIFLNNAASGSSWFVRGGVFYNSSSSPNITSCIFSNNTAEDTGGAFYNAGNSSVIITYSTFSANTSEFGGAFYNYIDSALSITHCAFSNNSALEKGGAIFNWGTSTSINNCTFTYNSAPRGGAFYNYAHGTSLTITHSTFTNNSANSYYGGAFYNDYNSPTIMNSIIWNNSPNRIYNLGGSIPSINYCIIQGGYTGVGNLNQDPMLKPLGDYGGPT